MLPGGSSKFYQPYQIDASIKFDWNPGKETYTGPAPYGYDSATQPHAPFYLMEYKFDEADLTPTSGDRKKPGNCTIQKGSTVKISLQSTTQNRGSEVLAALPTVYEECN